MIVAGNANNTPPLPLDVFREITQYLTASLSDLLTASLASCILRDEAQRILFRHPSRIIFQQLQATSAPNTTLRLSDNKFAAFIDAIMSSPDRLGPLVRTYTHQQCNTVPPENLEKINSALRSMTNLKRLAFTGARNLPTSILRECTFQLDAFSWGHAEAAMRILQDFLPSQASLKHLTFPCCDKFTTEETRMLAASICPKLESLTGGLDAVNLFLKNRKVIYLHWDDNLTYSPLTWPFDTIHETPKPLEADDVLDSEIAQIRYLRYIPSPNRQLSELLGKLQSIVLLEAPTKAAAANGNLILLSKIPTLRVLILSYTTYVTQSQFDFVRDILTCCPHLLYVDLEVHFAVFQRFNKASLTSTPIRGVKLAESAIYDPYFDPPSPSDPQSNSFGCAFTSISAFDGIPRVPSLFGDIFPPLDINFERDFGLWFQPDEPLDTTQGVDTQVGHATVNFERDFGQWFTPDQTR